MELGDHLFRHEAGRMVAVLTRIFGVHNLALVEDVVQDAFCRALEVWKFRGVPDNPSAWLMATAKHRALDILRRERTARRFAPELGQLLETEWALAPVVEESFDESTIADEQLRMMFTCCHPRLSEEGQIALMLHILCGFSVREVAAAFMSSHAAGELNSLVEQDRSRWDARLIAEGHRLLELSEAGKTVTPYHLEAAIAAVHANARHIDDTNWTAIVTLYDMLLAIAPSPVVALNRAIAVAQHAGPERGLAEIEAIEGRDRLATYPFYAAALGELELRRGEHERAREHFRTALALARNPMERHFLRQRLTARA